MQQKCLNSKDVIRVTEGQQKGQTGVVNRVDGDRVNVFLKGQYIGIWFSVDELKRIGWVHSKFTREECDKIEQMISDDADGIKRVRK